MDVISDRRDEQTRSKLYRRVFGRHGNAIRLLPNRLLDGVVLCDLQSQLATEQPQLKGDVVVSRTN